MSRRWYMRLAFCVVITFIISCVIVVHFEQRKIKSILDPVQKITNNLHLPEHAKLSDLVKRIQQDKEIPVLQIMDNITKWSSDHLPDISKTYQSLKNVIKSEIKEVLNHKDSFALERNSVQTNDPASFEVSYDVHVFYYPWYENLKFDQKWKHWNHPRLPHWKKDEIGKYSTDPHVPEDDIAADFYPQLGPYSSRDPAVIAQHMKWIKQSGAGVLIVSWYPPGQGDDNGDPLDPIFPALLDAADRENLKVAFHIEPYKGRKILTFREDLKYIAKTYGNHPAMFRTKKHGKVVPVYYVYDSYLIPFKEWARILTRSGELSIRGSDIDGFFLGLLVDLKHRFEIKKAGFDGFYTYFAADGFTYGSSWKNWRDLSSFARQNSLAFVPSVGPGYIDAQVRPWNGENTRGRKNGKYYSAAWKTAINSRPKWITVTSFNEWHEGSQIEPAIEKNVKDRSYLSYQPKNTTFYLDLTKSFVKEFCDTV